MKKRNKLLAAICWLLSVCLVFNPLHILAIEQTPPTPLTFDNAFTDFLMPLESHEYTISLSESGSVYSLVNSDNNQTKIEIWNASQTTGTPIKSFVTDSVLDGALPFSGFMVSASFQAGTYLVRITNTSLSACEYSGAFMLKPNQFTLQAATKSIKVGSNFTLSHSILPIEAASTRVKFTSSKPSVATVDTATGKVTAKAIGTAIITAETELYGQTASCTVTVLPNNLTKLTLPSSRTTEPKKQFSLSSYLKRTPSNSKERVIWTSSNRRVATVNSSGVVKGIAPGKAIITATSASKKAVARCTVTVKSVAARSVKFSRSTLYVRTRQKIDIKKYARVLPANFTAKPTFKVNRAAVAYINRSGILIGRKKGTAIVQMSVSGKRSLIKIIVR